MIGVIFDWLRHHARSRRWSPDLALGRRGEDLAHRYLRRKGFKIVARNYRLASGTAEADVIAWEGAELVFIEVKSRRSGEYGPPDRAVGEEKRPSAPRRPRIRPQDQYALGPRALRPGERDPYGSPAARMAPGGVQGVIHSTHFAAGLHSLPKSKLNPK
jgi:hypothetical protein